jgi:hypothetical protein
MSNSLLSSRLEWFAQLNPSKAPKTTDETKNLRKVRPITSRSSIRKVKIFGVDGDYCDHRLVAINIIAGLTLIGAPYVLGPKTNNVKRLGELRKAGVNVGEYSGLHPG